MTERPDYHIIIRRVLEANRLGARDDGGVGIGELASLIQDALNLGHRSVIVHPDDVPEAWEVTVDQRAYQSHSERAFFCDGYRVCRGLVFAATKEPTSNGQPTLLPAENMALTIASAQCARGENPPINTTTMLVLALDRIIAAANQEGTE